MTQYDKPSNKLSIFVSSIDLVKADAKLYHRKSLLVSGYGTVVRVSTTDHETESSNPASYGEKDSIEPIG